MTEDMEHLSKPKILYIMGVARGGSTILEILLSKGENCFGAGEIHALIQDGFIENQRCACGATCQDCEIWGRVKTSFDCRGEDFKNLASLQYKVDWHDGLVRQLLGRVSVTERQKYRQLNNTLAQIIQDKTGAGIILDSSKYAGRALAWRRITAADISVLCLTRSPAGLMASFQKPNREEQRPKNPLNVLAYYIVTLASLRIVSLILGRQVLSIRYEDLVSNPIHTLDEIETWCGVDLAAARQGISDNEYFDVGHIITGNRLRKKGRVRFEPNLKFIARPVGRITRLFIFVMNTWKWMLRF